MNPLLSLIIVIALLILFLRGLYFLKNKAPSFAFFRNKFPHQGIFDHNIQMLYQHSIDHQYKIVTFLVDGKKHAFLLGPTHAIALGYEQADDSGLSATLMPKQDIVQ